MHTPISQERNDADKAVVFIHGFMGSPDQFAELAAAVYNSGCSCYCLLLPGHGAGAREFIKRGIDDWERHLQAEISKVRDKYDKIYLVGHSMGGLLALNASLNRENKIAGVFLLSTPLKFNVFSLKSLAARVRFLAYPKDHEVKAAYHAGNSLAGASVFAYPLFIKPILHSQKLIRKTKRQLADVFVPVYMVHSKNDETISHKSGAMLYEGLCNTRRTAFSIDRSWHAFYAEEERGVIAEKLVGFIG